jgi:oligosaccharide repeat unit polymerase
VIFFFILAISVLALLNRHWGRSWLYPPALFCTEWSVLLAGVALSGSHFYPIHVQTLTLYLVGAICFSLGGILTSAQKSRATSDPYSSSHLAVISRFLNIATLILLGLVPFYLQYVKNDLAGSPSASWLDPQLWRAARLESIARELADKQAGDMLGAGVMSLTLTLPLLCFIERNNGRFGHFRMWCSIITGLTCSLASAGRFGAFVILVGIGSLMWSEHLRIKLKFVFIGLLTLVCVYAPAAVMMNKGGSIDYSVGENILGVLDMARDYALVGPVAFDAIMADPTAIPSVWRPDRFFLLTANRLGAHFDVHSIHAEFTSAGDGVYQNVYTFYFAYYPDFGWPGVVVISCAFGALSAWLYRRLPSGDRLAKLMFAYMIFGIFLSGFVDGFFLQLSTILKAFIVGNCLYWLPKRFIKIEPASRAVY